MCLCYGLIIFWYLYLLIQQRKEILRYFLKDAPVTNSLLDLKSGFAGG